MNQIIFVSHDPLTLSIKNNFYLERFIADGIKIRYLCVRNILSYAKNSKLENEILTDYYTEIFNITELQNILESSAGISWICLELWENWDALKIYKIVKPYSNRIFSINWYRNVPTMTLKRKFFDDLRSYNFYKLYQAALRFLNRKAFDRYAKFSKINFSYLLFVPGKGMLKTLKNRNVIAINHHDYETFQQEVTSKGKNLINEKYAVFIDTMLPEHPDFKRLNSTTLKADSYYNELNHFFNQLENKFHLKIIIAAHPKSNYKNEFGNRCIIKNETNILIRHADFVIVHYSAAINYAVLNSKPILFFYTKEFINVSAGNFALQIIYYTILLYSEILDSSVVNISYANSFQLKPVSCERYQKFVEQYIKGQYDIKNYELLNKTLFSGSTGRITNS